MATIYSNELSGAWKNRCAREEKQLLQQLAPHIYGPSSSRSQTPAHHSAPFATEIEPKKLGESSTNANHGLATDSRAASSVARGTSRSQATRRTGKSTVRNSSSKRPDTACSSVSSMSRMSGTSVATSKFSEFSVNTSRRCEYWPLLTHHWTMAGRNLMMLLR